MVSYGQHMPFSTARLGPFTVSFDNSEEYHRLKGEIFTQDCYYFETESVTPVIIDAGAHIGLATLYFKKLYPHARIIAIEPNPDTGPIFEENIWQNGLEDVTLIQAAMTGSSGGSINLFRDRTSERWWSTASMHKGAWTGDQKSEFLTVPTISLEDVFARLATILGVSVMDLHVDALKMDIEGAEQVTLAAGRHLLPQIDHLFIEFHPVGGQELVTLLEWLDPFFTVNLTHDDRPVTLDKARGLIMIEAERRPTK